MAFQLTLTLWNTREPWLIAWGLVDLKKGETILEAELAMLDREKSKEVRLWSTGIFPVVELLIVPPEHRESVLGRRSAGGYWRPESGGHRPPRGPHDAGVP